MFIQAKNLHYGLDFCPAFWDWLIAQNQRENVFSIKEVADEIIKGNDELVDWVQERGKRLFRKPDRTIPSIFFEKVSKWANEQSYSQAAVSTFLKSADYYLVTHALASSYTVVTHEIAANSTTKIKIPNACAGLDIDYMTPFEMLRLERALFVLEEPHEAGQQNRL